MLLTQNHYDVPALFLSAIIYLVLKFKQILFPLILILLTVLICFLNYTPNTFLTGWDTLHPELNFSLNFSRLLNIWHFEQGLGAIPAHAQIADLPRVFILYLFHFILPLNFLRYSYIFLCLILGPLGIYFLIKSIFHKSNYQTIIAFIISLLYIFNLSTIQQFYVPFEMFPTQWAFLPWIIFFSLQYLKNNKRKYLILFSIFTLFATPQAYAAQLWYAFFFIYTLFLIIYSRLNKNHFSKAFKLFLFTLLLNSFWLIPNIFYIFTSSSAPKLNRDNRLYSQEYLLKNRSTGTLTSSTIVKGFYLDWSVYDFDQKRFEDLMPVWQNHLNNKLVLSIGYSIFILSLLGLIICFIKKDKLFISLSPFFIIPFILLSNKVPIFSKIFDFLIQNSTIRESFRFIFTKLSILLMFGIVIFFAYSLHFIFEKIKSIKLIYFATIFISTAIVFYAFPIFQGNLISPKVKVNIPDQYFKTWELMSIQDDGRILTLPLNQSSGWQYYNWGYQGSGFLWFNLKQNLLDRDSDRWSNQNEQAYKEFFNSLYSQNQQQFFQDLQKYQIKYIIWDQNIIYPSLKNNEQITFKNEINTLLNELESQNKITKLNQFDSIYIYQINISSSDTKIENINNFVKPSYKWGYLDAANSQNYITDNINGVYFPFRDLLDQNQKIDIDKINIQKNEYSQWQITLKNEGHQFKLPSIKSTEDLIPVNVYLKNIPNSSKVIFQLPFPMDTTNSIKTEFDIPKNSSKIKINDTEFLINQGNSNLQLLGNVNIFVHSNNFLNDKIIDFGFNSSKNFYLKNISLVGGSIDFNPNTLLKSTNKTDNYSIDLPHLPHSFGYIIALKSKYISGIPLRICLKNNYSFLCSIEDEVNKNLDSQWDYFLVPSTGNDLGYSLSINNISYGGFTSESLLDQVSIIPIPFNMLNQVESENQNNLSANFFILNQSYNDFWLAFYFDGIKPVFLKNHVLANNWANAWEMPDNINISQIKIIFWPQILEFLGLGLTIFTLVWIFKKK